MSIAAGLHRDLGLTDDELAAIQQRLGRDPTYTELAMFSVMWSEHCSYKSSRIHLRNLPTEAPHILVGPGEGAGIIEVAPGVSVAWKIESHNHPSFVEPFNGAATGVGGIVRDILSMGARPIALMDPLRFGPLQDPRTSYLVEGVVHGISAYGNAIGVPTVGGEVSFEDCYAENPLVNVACLGVIEDKLMHGRAEGEGNVVVLIGSSTGRDGIGGASVLASAEFDDSSGSKRPSVQVGDPFTEKLLIEACLELVRRDLLVGFQDLGAGGISCPTAEMAAKAGTGMRIDIAAVHLREADMEPFEIMISESQERMLAVVEPADLDAVLGICRKWELGANVLGSVTKSGRVQVVREDQIVADVPADALAEEGPVYDRDLDRPSWLDELHASSSGDEAPQDLRDAFLRLVACPAVASKRWVWEQYDHMIFLGTVQGPGGDAAVVRLPSRDVAVAISVDGQARFCYLDPYEGARLAVAEAARNVAIVGGTPLAVTNCLNFGNPEKPEVMWQFAEVVRGIGDACRELGTPVTGGNVSFYNETKGRAIYPTPVIGMLGSVPDPERSVGSAFRRDGDSILLVGSTADADFGGSEYAKTINGRLGGRPPRLDLAREKALHRFLIEGASRGLFASAHDCSEGGLGIALAESALAGSLGFSVQLDHPEPHRLLFSETPSRALVSSAPGEVEAVTQLAHHHGLPTAVIGSVCPDVFDLGVFQLEAGVVRDVFENAFEADLTASMS